MKCQAVAGLVACLVLNAHARAFNSIGGGYGNSYNGQLVHGSSHTAESSISFAAAESHKSESSSSFVAGSSLNAESSNNLGYGLGGGYLPGGYQNTGGSQIAGNRFRGPRYIVHPPMQSMAIMEEWEPLASVNANGAYGQGSQASASVNANSGAPASSSVFANSGIRG